jgi:glycosyltransferase involved in cell wall biosynthesis
MSKADAFVLASEFEGLPNVLVQAMAFGTPIVATDCKSGPSEILCGGRYGTLVPVGDARALTQGLERALKQPRQLEAMAHARSMYGARNAAHEYLAMAGLVV